MSKACEECGSETVITKIFSSGMTFCLSCMRTSYPTAAKVLTFDVERAKTQVPPQKFLHMTGDKKEKIPWCKKKGQVTFDKERVTCPFCKRILKKIMLGIPV